MKIAYLISVYKYPAQLIRLVKQLSTDSTYFFIHVDQRTSHEVYRQMVNGLNHLPKVFFLERHKCYWGDFGHVRATIKGIKALFNLNISINYVILLTGQDYPIKSNSQIVDYLKKGEDKSFISYFSLPYDLWCQGGLDRIERWHFSLLSKRIQLPNKYLSFLPKRNFPKGFKPFGGPSYWCLSGECIEYIHDFINQNHQFIDYYEFVNIPDEGFFQTILLNSPLKTWLVNDDLRFIKWPPGAPNPQILGKQDLEDMISSSKLFARKFDLTQDLEILDLLDQKISTFNMDSREI